MRIVAIEEAFSIPGMTPPFVGSQNTLAPEWASRWDRLLADVYEERLADMDANGVDVQVLSLTSGVELTGDAAIAVERARQANDHLARIVAAHPDRFAGFAALPLQDPAAAATELRRAVQDLGLVGALQNDHVGGTYLDDARFDLVWTELERLDVPLYLHPGMVPSQQLRLYDGMPALGGPSWGWTAATGGHALRLIYGGVFDRHPAAKLILGHMGELLPFQLARLDSRYEQAPVTDRPDRLPSIYLRRNLYITTSGLFSHPALMGAISSLGIDHVLFAIDYPYERSEEAVEFLHTAPLAPADLARLAHTNADHILRLPTAGTQP